MFYKSRFSARWFSIGMAFALLILLAACAQPTPTPTPKPTPTPTATPRPLATPTPTPKPTPTPIKGEGQVVMFGMGVWEKAMVGQFIPKFEKETGCKVTLFTALSSQMLARLKAEAGKPTIDVAHLHVGEFIPAKAQSLLDKNNRQILTNLKDVDRRLLDPDDIGTPFVISPGAVLGVRHDKLKEKNLPMPESWLDMANPAYKGKVGIVDIGVSPAPAFVALVARSLGGNEVNDYARAFDWMETKLKSNILAISAPAEWQKLITEGSMWVGMAHWARATTTLQASPDTPLTLVWPKEGTNIDLMGYQAVKGATNPICTQLWMNFTMAKDVQEAVPESLVMGPARGDVTIPEKMKALVISTKDMNRGVDLNLEAIAKNMPDWTERWNKIFAK
ncbi:MAG: extracellular solute-binding protein [Chloroflexi bacterium]|nr:extracellular solute-binding protein [Chloroflexota bacterium]